MWSSLIIALIGIGTSGARMVVIAPTETAVVAAPKPLLPIAFSDPHLRISYKCLVMELAHFNEVNIQYHYRGKSGEGIDRTYAYELEIGEEKYEMSDRSEKRAKDEIAMKALRETAHKFPSNAIDVCTFSYSAQQLVHEWAQKHKRMVSYTLIEQRTRPSPMFVMECVLSRPDLVTRGSGADRKAAIMDASEQMLMKLQSINESAYEVPLSPELAVDMHPVSRLHELCNLKGLPEPIFRLMDVVTSKNENGTKSTIFIVRVQSNAIVATGSGTTIRAAKRDASKNLLKTLNFAV